MNPFDALARGFADIFGPPAPEQVEPQPEEAEADDPAALAMCCCTWAALIALAVSAFMPDTESRAPWLVGAMVAIGAGFLINALFEEPAR